ncbi:MAG: LTA synthase family protein [Thermodesulfobacteriota bacterium]
MWDAAFANPAKSRVATAYLFGGVFLGISTGLRLALAVKAWRFLEGGLAVFFKMMGVGLLMDLVTLSYFGIPYLAFLVLAPRRLYSSRTFAPFLYLASMASIYLVLFTAVAEWFFFQEFATRFNFIAVDYLVYTQEVLGNIWESYPMVPILLGILLGAVVIWWPLSKAVRVSRESRDSLRARALWAAPWACSAVLFGLTAHLDWSRLCGNNYVNEIASNGIYSFVSAFQTNQMDYESFYPTMDPDRAMAKLKEQLAEPKARFLSSDPWDLRRSVTSGGTPGGKKLNLALIVVESLSGDYVAALGGRKKLTPRLDRLAPECLVFTNIYATGTRTDRGLEAITLSVPPSPGRSLVKRPGNENLFSLGWVLKEQGYRVEFIYGGYGYFDNMNHFFSHNGFQVVDRSDFASHEVTFSNAWGVCDEDLYRKVLSRMRESYREGKPFFGLILTTSNHRPYTYPEGRVKVPSGKGRAGAVLYTDWAMGQFLEKAREEPWFEDTLFVIVADHCANSAGKAALPVDRYRIPLLIYSPKWVKPGKVETLGSQMDLAPTLLALLGVDYTSKFLGRNLLDIEPQEARGFMATYQKLGYLKGRHLVVLDVRRPPAQYLLVPGTKDLEAVDPDDSMIQEAVSYYQGAYLIHRLGLDKWEDENRTDGADNRGGA